jgi:hypothetical protein
VNWRRGRRVGVSAIGLDIVSSTGKMSTEADQAQLRACSVNHRLRRCDVDFLLDVIREVAAKTL